MIYPKRRKPQKTGANHKEKRFPKHLKWVRGHECGIQRRHDCEGKIEAAHVRRGTDGGTSTKPSDFFTIPLCSAAHAEQHQKGEQSFEKKYDFKMLELAMHLKKTSPHRHEWENEI